MALSRNFDKRARFIFKFALPDMLQRAGQFRGRNGGKEAQSADVDAQQWCGGTSDVLRGAQHRAVPAEDHQQIHLARERGDVAIHKRFAPGALDETRRPADNAGALGLLGIADQPDAPDFICFQKWNASERLLFAFFNQH
jgi:hypothetical protein